MAEDQEFPNYKKMSEDMAEEIEKLHIRIAKGFTSHASMPGFLTTLQKKWESLSYMEKVYTISMMVIAGSILMGQLVAILRHEDNE